MKRVPCSGPGACKVKYSYEAQDYVPIKRDVEVPDDHEGAAYCSFECAAYAGHPVIQPPRTAPKDVTQPSV